MHHKLSDDRSEEVRVLATACGFALGAASMCPSIPEVRLAVAVDRLRDIVEVLLVERAPPGAHLRSQSDAKGPSPEGAVSRD